MEPVAEDPLPPRESLNEASRLLLAGRAFAAHEVLEARWKAAPEMERDLWQGLAQLCVGLTHLARGNHAGGTRLLERGARRIESYQATSGPTYGLPLSDISAHARHSADDPPDPRWLAQALAVSG